MHSKKIEPTNPVCYDFVFICFGIRKCLSLNGLFAQPLRYAKKIILGISDRCLWLFFSQALILEKIAILGQPHRKVSMQKAEEICF